LIRIELDEAALGATRIAMSPLRDAFCAIHLAPPFRSPSWPYQEWVVTAREVWRQDERLGPLRDLLAHRPEVSDFLLPRPVGTADVYEELDLLRATDPAFVREQVGACYAGLEDRPFLRPYLTDPEAACAALADAYAAWWDGAVAPYWPVMRRLVEDEVLVRARTFATEGVDALFAGLESRARWERPVLELTKYVEAEYAAGERRLVLVPMVSPRAAGSTRPTTPTCSPSTSRPRAPRPCGSPRSERKQPPTTGSGCSSAGAGPPSCANWARR